MGARTMSYDIRYEDGRWTARDESGAVVAEVQTLNELEELLDALDNSD